MALQPNDQAPDFKLKDQNGQERALSDYKGQWVLLYFYPRDMTPGCTVEACTLGEAFPKFGKLKAAIIGISTDTVESHKKFSDKYKLPFTLLADPEKKVVELYGVWAKKKFMGKEFMGTLRTSFLINPAGKIHKIYEKVKPIGHADEVLKDLSA